MYKGEFFVYGYVRTHTPELKVREQEYYRAVYCGLCRTMGKCTGQCSRMSLSYDFTFFALLRLALTKTTVEIKPRRCPVHPLRKQAMVEPNRELTLCACLSAILAYHKLRDDLCDERGGRRVLARMVSPYVKGIRRRAVKRGYAEADRRVEEAMDRLWELEATRPSSVDEPATLFGELMATLLAYGLEGGSERLAHALGLHIGRWVYILDAIDDFEEDAKTGRYNPLRLLYHDPSMTTLPLEKREGLRTALLNELAELEKAFDLLDTENAPDLRGLLSNVLYRGMPREAQRVLFDSGTSSKKKNF